MYWYVELISINLKAMKPKHNPFSYTNYRITTATFITTPDHNKTRSAIVYPTDRRAHSTTHPVLHTPSKAVEIGHKSQQHYTVARDDRQGGYVRKMCD